MVATFRGRFSRGTPPSSFHDSLSEECRLNSGESVCIGILFCKRRLCASRVIEHVVTRALLNDLAALKPASPTSSSIVSTRLSRSAGVNFGTWRNGSGGDLADAHARIERGIRILEHELRSQTEVRSMVAVTSLPRNVSQSDGDRRRLNEAAGED
ncbi:hypothetical protein [Bradyrhizobium sp. BR 10261]|uniref:hypothetical protein n=1 Tax=Bradyrhizobium sp. BR 10261 TaxID=2749992 RepID=UPI001C6488E4|nr:hypothetical protein [Bradyrhizobium sp. BR 10261]MBW7966649.1 hypothetical protein [Bradyrhizobium sp. BR 10261]